MSGRTPRWPEKVEASELVLNLYRAIAAVQARPDLFLDCHVFEGATLKHVPYVSCQNETVQLPRVISTFLGVNLGKKICATHGCANPLHFQGYNSIPLKGLSQPDIPKSDFPEMSDYLEAVQHYIDTHEVNDFPSLRALIPIEDISDEILKLSLEKLKP